MLPSDGRTRVRSARALCGCHGDSKKDIEREVDLKDEGRGSKPAQSERDVGTWRRIRDARRRPKNHRRDPALANSAPGRTRRHRLIDTHRRSDLRRQGERTSAKRVSPMRDRRATKTAIGAHDRRYRQLEISCPPPTETEALAARGDLIKRLRPRFNG